MHERDEAFDPTHEVFLVYPLPHVSPKSQGAETMSNRTPCCSSPMTRVKIALGVQVYRCEAQ